MRNEHRKWRWYVMVVTSGSITEAIIPVHYIGQIITTHLRSGTRKFHLRVSNLQMSCMPFRENKELTAIYIYIWHHIDILFSSRSSLVCLNLLSSCLSYSCHILHYHVFLHIHICHIYWKRGWLNQEIHIKLCTNNSHAILIHMGCRG